MRLETVKVKRDGPRGWHIINESDYDPDVHELVEDAPAPVAKNESPVETKDESPVDPLDALPENWRETSGRGVTKLKEIAEAVSGRTPSNKDEAVAIIDEALAKRAAAGEGEGEGEGGETAAAPEAPAASLTPPPGS